MKATSDKLTVTFDNSLNDEAGICVARVVNGKVVILKMELGEQAELLYRALIDQSFKISELKGENNVGNV